VNPAAGRRIDLAPVDLAFVLTAHPANAADGTVHRNLIAIVGEALAVLGAHRGPARVISEMAVGHSARRQMGHDVAVRREGRHQKARRLAMAKVVPKKSDGVGGAESSMPHPPRF